MNRFFDIFNALLARGEPRTARRNEVKRPTLLENLPTGQLSLATTFEGAPQIFRRFWGPHRIISEKLGRIPHQSAYSPVVSRISEARVHANGAVILDDGSRVGGHWLNNPIGTELAPLPAVKREGIKDQIFVLSTPFSKNFYHWIFEVLPAVVYAADVLDFRGPFYVDQYLPWQRQSLRSISRRQLDAVCCTSHPAIRANEALLIERFDPFTAINPWVASVLRERFWGAHHGRKGRRLYVSRQDATHRRVLNEARLISALRKLGFEIVVPSKVPFMSQVELFRSAELVVGPHGAGLANSVFCVPGSTLVELSPPRYIFPCWADLAEKAGLNFAWIPAKNADDRTDHGWKYQSESFTVDIPAVIDVLEHGLSEKNELRIP